jgi:hypothetical protein
MLLFSFSLNVFFCFEFFGDVGDVVIMLLMMLLVILMLVLLLMMMLM